MAGPVTLKAFCGLSAPPKAVWALIGDFAKPQAWLPGIERVKIQGRLRTCQTPLGCFRERLIAEGRRRCSYAIEDGPIPVENYVAVLSVLPSTSFFACQVKWESTFEVKAGTDWCALTQKFARIYDAGLRSLQTRYGSEHKDPLFRTEGADVSIDILLKSLKSSTNGPLV
jgi:Polyketide cyclase / dehydrase and lipid transport